MLKAINFILLVGSLTAISAYAQCDKTLATKLKIEGAKLSSCTRYKQNDGRSYVSALHIFKNTNKRQGANQATVSHYLVEGDSSLKLVAQESGLGEFFVDLTYRGEKSKLVVHDFNGDNKLEVAFRSYSVPHTMLKVHSFDDKGALTSSIQQAVLYEGKKELSPYFTFYFDDEVHIEDGKIYAKRNGKQAQVYLFKEGSYLLKN